MIEDTYKYHILEHALTKMYTIEFKKLGLLHMYFLPFFKKINKVKDLANVDSIIYAKFLIKKEDPLLFEIINTCIVYDSYRPQNI